jgi:hypothetical protein
VNLDTSSKKLTRADQRELSKANSVAFVKARKRIAALVSAHQAAVDAFVARGPAAMAEPVDDDADDDDDESDGGAKRKGKGKGKGKGKREKESSDEDDGDDDDDDDDDDKSGDDSDGDSSSESWDTDTSSDSSASSRCVSVSVTACRACLVHLAVAHSSLCGSLPFLCACSDSGSVELKGRWRWVKKTPTAPPKPIKKPLKCVLCGCGCGRTPPPPLPPPSRVTHTSRVHRRPLCIPLHVQCVTLAVSVCRVSQGL